MQVGMGQLPDLVTGRTLSAGISIVTVGTVQVLGVSNGQRERACTGIARKQLGMTDAPGFDAAHQMSFDRILSQNGFELHRIVVLRLGGEMLRPEIRRFIWCRSSRNHRCRDPFRSILQHFPRRCG